MSPRGCVRHNDFRFVLRSDVTADGASRDDHGAGAFGVIFHSIGGEDRGAGSTGTYLESYVHDTVLRLVGLLFFHAANAKSTFFTVHGVS